MMVATQRAVPELDSSVSSAGMEGIPPLLATSVPGRMAARRRDAGTSSRAGAVVGDIGELHHRSNRH
jgi:hypothetical protein